MNANAVKVFKKGNGEFRILRYTPGDGVDLHPRGWIPSSGVYDPVEAASERSEPANPARIRARIFVGYCNKKADERWIKLRPNRGPEHQWCDRARNEHNVNV